MSREIKFRWWNGQQMVTHRNIGVLAKNINNLRGIMQYTGLKDRNGVEIYEGDYTKDIDGIVGVIEWSQEECGWLWMNKYEAQSPFGEAQSPFGACEVIGNIYEHPHLLEGE